MKTLLQVEMRRLVARRLFRWLTVLAVVAFGIAGTAAFIASSDSADALAEAHARHRADVAGCIRAIESEDSGEYPVAAHRDPRAFCEEEVWFDDPRFAYREMPWILSSLGIPVMLLGWLVGASSIGAEWSNRSLTTMLTWESRRSRVIVAKALAAAAVVFVWVVALQLLFSGAMLPAAALEGTTSGIDTTWMRQYAELMLRVGGLATIAALMGFAVAAIGRNTAAAMGVGFVQLGIVEALIRAFRPSWTDWLVGDNTAMVLIGPGDVTHLGHSQLGAALLLTAYALAAVGLAALVFRRREVA